MAILSIEWDPCGQVVNIFLDFCSDSSKPTTPTSALCDTVAQWRTARLLWHFAPGDVQRRSVARGITYAEFNNSKAEQFHFLQIWILPEERDVALCYENFSAFASRLPA
jgi:hypothetical protein